MNQWNQSSRRERRYTEVILLLLLARTDVMGVGSFVLLSIQATEFLINCILCLVELGKPVRWAFEEWHRKSVDEGCNQNIEGVLVTEREDVICYFDKHCICTAGWAENGLKKIE